MFIVYLVCQKVLSATEKSAGQAGITGLGRHTMANRVSEEGALNEKVRSKQNLKVGK